MITRFRYGTPFATDTVIKAIAIEEGKQSLLQEKEGSFCYEMDEKDIVFGLGENNRGINKRGFKYISNCTDDPTHTEDKVSLYAAHNFIIIKGKQLCGIFFDYAGKITFDVGYTHLNQLVITPEDHHFDLYVIEGESLLDIVKQFRGIIGTSYIPPKWGFGFGQSRWGYENEQDILDVVEGYKKNNIPLDSVYMDIDYMDEYADFTVDTKKFPDLKGLVERLKKENIHLVPIIDAGVKIKEGDATYEEGVANNYFCKDEEGNDFVGAVWPGRVHFPDMLNKDVRKWFGDKYKFLLDMGIEGFWNDMNEPAIFYSEKRLQEAIVEVNQLSEGNLGIDFFFKIGEIVRNLSNSPKDYASFYHNVDGEKVRHDKVHNLYGYNMTRAAGESFEELEKDKRILMFSRASCIGMHRYGGVWLGDNHSWWSHLLLNLKMLPSMNMCGFLYTGADIGGFGADTTEDLVLRWTALGIFTPLMRNHSVKYSRNQECYRFDNKEAFRNIIGMRYGLMPYLYSEYMKAALNDDMLFKPLCFEYTEDEYAPYVEDQLLVGESMMIAPVYEQNARGRYVYLPETMKCITMKSMSDMKEKVLEKGHHFVDVALDEVVVFIRPNKIVPIAQAANSVAEVDWNNLCTLSFVQQGKVEYSLYNDDGYGKDYTNKANYTVITVEAE